MEPSSRDLNTPCLPVKPVENTLLTAGYRPEANKSTSLPTLARIKSFEHRFRTSSARSDTSSLADSVFDHSPAATVCSAISSISLREYNFSEARAAELRENTSSCRGSSNLSRLPESRDFPSSSSSSLKIPQNSVEIPTDGPVNNISKDQPNCDIYNHRQERPDDAESELDNFDTEDEDNEHNEWSGEPDRVEAAVLAHVEDLGFATWLIMKIHRDQVHSEAQMIGGWQKGMLYCQASPESGGGRQSYSNSDGSEPSASPRKRKRHYVSNDKDPDDADGEERHGGEGGRSPEDYDEGGVSREPSSQYACPFNKSDPARFCVNPNTGNQFRVCESGFKSIQRLKEHIKRKHVLIYCKRCFKDFSGDKKTLAERIAELDNHSQQPEHCALSDSRTIDFSLGLSLERWWLLAESGGRGKSLRRTFDMEKWFNIWKIIYPGTPHPDHPWAERTIHGLKPQPVSGNNQNFLNLFESSLDHYIDSGNIRFMPGEELIMKDRLKSLVRKVFNVHMSLSEPPSLANTSSNGRTETRITTASTPILESQDVMAVAQRQMSDPMNSHGSQALRVPKSHPTVPMDMNAQPRFPILTQHISPNIAFEPSNFHDYGGGQLARVPAALSAPPQAMPQQRFNFYVGDDWSSLPFHLSENPEDQDILYLQQDESN
ncbi:hypothetical protein F4781DRAFT_417583 [Annulohypoxylon bovei var. microspora]|nr:hypothetical protein F4781DRAFT_417583 [Annulohypoxylon bovei var. microspora]